MPLSPPPPGTTVVTTAGARGRDGRSRARARAVRERQRGWDLCVVAPGSQGRGAPPGLRHQPRHLQESPPVWRPCLIGRYPNPLEHLSFPEFLLHCCDFF